MTLKSLSSFRTARIIGVEHILARRVAGGVISFLAICRSRQKGLVLLQTRIGKVAQHLIDIRLLKTHLGELLLVCGGLGGPLRRVCCVQQIIHRIRPLLEDLAVLGVEIGLLVFWPHRVLRFAQRALYDRQTRRVDRPRLR